MDKFVKVFQMFVFLQNLLIKPAQKRGAKKNIPIKTKIAAAIVPIMYKFFM